MGMPETDSVKCDHSKGGHILHAVGCNEKDAEGKTQKLKLPTLQTTPTISSNPTREPCGSGT